MNQYYHVSATECFEMMQTAKRAANAVTYAAQKAGHDAVVARARAIAEEEDDGAAAEAAAAARGDVDGDGDGDGDGNASDSDIEYTAMGDDNGFLNDSGAVQLDTLGSIANAPDDGAAVAGPPLITAAAAGGGGGGGAAAIAADAALDEAFAAAMSPKARRKMEAKQKKLNEKGRKKTEKENKKKDKADLKSQLDDPNLSDFEREFIKKAAANNAGNFSKTHGTAPASPPVVELASNPPSTTASPSPIRSSPRKMASFDNGAGAISEAGGDKYKGMKANEKIRHKKMAAREEDGGRA